MSDINFDELFKNLTAEVASIARDSLKDYENEAKADGEYALENIKVNLQQ